MKYRQDISWYKNNYLNSGFIKEESSHYYFYVVKNALPFPIEKFAINKNGEFTILFLSKEKTKTIEQKYTNFFVDNKIK